MPGNQRPEAKKRGGRDGGRLDFAYLRGRIATALHCRPAEVRAMPLPDVWDLLEYWHRQPPEHEVAAMLLASFTDWRPPAASAPEPASDQERTTAAEVARALGGTPKPMPPRLRALLQDAETMNARLAGAVG